MANEYLNDAKFIAISPSDYDNYQELKKLDNRRTTFDDKLNEDPFYSGLEHRLLQMRYHLLQALGFEEKRDFWRTKNLAAFEDSKYKIFNETIKNATDTEFLDAIEATGVNVDFKLK